MPPKRPKRLGSTRIHGTKRPKKRASTKTVSHSKKSTPTKKASKVKKSAVKRDSKGRFAPKVKKNITRERYKKAGLKYVPKKPHAPVFRKKKKIVQKDTTHLEREPAPNTVTDKHGKPRFVPNVRSEPFDALPRINPDTRTKLDPNAILEAIRQSYETELDTTVTGKVVEVTDHGGFQFHEYQFVYDDIAVNLESLESLFGMARPYLRPHYRSLTNLIALVGFEHEDRQSMEIAPRSLAATTFFDHAFMEIPQAVDRWGTSTPYKKICGVAIHVKTPDWWQPADKQILPHKKVKHGRKTGSKGKRKGPGSRTTAVSKVQPKLRSKSSKKESHSGSIKATRTKRKPAKRDSSKNPKSTRPVKRR
jgi:hypothetical protein